jgi:hypothetical protein
MPMTPRPVPKEFLPWNFALKENFYARSLKPL